MALIKKSALVLACALGIHVNDSHALTFVVTRSSDPSNDGPDPISRADINNQNVINAYLADSWAGERSSFRKVKNAILWYYQVGPDPLKKRYYILKKPKIQPNKKPALGGFLFR